MAIQEPTPAAPPSAEVVGNAFVEQYYHMLHQSPEMVHRFYQDSSLLSRPDVNGVMTKVTTMQAINEKIMSLNYKDHTVEIKTADAQESHEKGVIVLVTGCLTGKDNARRKFTQTFFLAPQDKGYFVLNDVFRYVGESESLVNGTSENAPAVALTTELGAINAPDQLAAEPAAAIEEEDVAEVCDPSDNEGSVLEEVTIESPVHKAAESTPAAEEDAPKTYASILKAMQGNAASRSIHVPTSRAAGGATGNVQQSTVSVPAKPSAPVTSPLVSDNAPESSNHSEEVEGHSIYIRNLPYNATVELLEEEFRKFGPIKPNGIQVRSAKQGSCFGFVEFEALSSMQSALEASPIAIGDHQAVVEEKRTTTRVTGNSGGSRGRYSSRGGFRSDSFRGRGIYGGGRGYGRNDFRTQGDYSGRPRGSAGRGVETYQRVNQNGLGRGGRQGGGNRSSVPPST
ncbi:nuclear transport factor 2-like [Rhodamnia argentea]|uniref:Nuclear transport factor 2-like n=1 Tax=Rhodamnia argentea TaxID=178133 RepID=A0A8B8PJJ6_9MYRT|nr:nuclear transport factor 2-like [Rhodamnia argentea]